jgi:hypothetical protein
VRGSVRSINEFRTLRTFKAVGQRSRRKTDKAFKVLPREHLVGRQDPDLAESHVIRGAIGGVL